MKTALSFYSLPLVLEEVLKVVYYVSQVEQSERVGINPRLDNGTLFEPYAFANRHERVCCRSIEQVRSEEASKV